jgi:hypothetical protein
MRSRLLIIALALLSLGMREVRIEEPWESCHAPYLTDAQAIAKWEADRTANNWGPNWSGATPIPARSELSKFTTSAATITHPGEPKYALSNSRAIYLFSQHGALRGGMDRARGVEIVRRDGRSTATNPSYTEITWLVGWGDANSHVETGSWGLSTTVPTSVTAFTDPLGGEGMRVVYNRDGLTLTTEYWLDGNALAILPKSITGTHVSG